MVQHEPVCLHAILFEVNWCWCPKRHKLNMPYSLQELHKNRSRALNHYDFFNVTCGQVYMLDEKDVAKDLVLIFPHYIRFESGDLFCLCFLLNIHDDKIF